MARFIILKLLLLNALRTGVYCTDQVALQESVHSSSLQASASCDYLSYAAIGDSYSAGLQSWYPMPTCNGPTICNQIACTSTLCARNTGAFGYLFANRYRSNFQFLACTGADTRQIQSQQVPCLKNNTQIVTLTAGGDNNNMFADVVGYCVYEFGYNCTTNLRNANTTIQNIDTDIINLWQSIKRQAPAARIYHFGYARFWPDGYNSIVNTCQDPPLQIPTSTAEAMNSLVNALNFKIASLASRHGVTFVPVEANFYVHRYCDRFTSWFLWRNVLSTNYHGGVFHPTEAGQESGYLKALETALGCTRPAKGHAEESLEIEYEL